MKKILLCAPLLILAGSVWAQNNTDGNLLTTAGGSTRIGTYLTDWSVGGTASSDSFQLPSGHYLTQGFLQPASSLIQLMLTFDSLPGKTYGDVNFELHGIASDGTDLVYTSEDESIAKIVNGNTVVIVGAGTTSITATIKNTNISKKQILAVDKATQTITFEVIDVLMKNGSPVTLKATSTSGLSVQFTNKNPFVVKLNGTELTPVDIGTATMEASQPGDKNYYPALVSQTVRVIDPSGAQLSVPLVVTPNGDGINDQFVIKGIENFPDNHLVIVNRNGTKVYEATNYNNSELIFSGAGDARYEFKGKPAPSQSFLPQGTYYYVIDYKDGANRKRHTGYFVLKF